MTNEIILLDNYAVVLQWTTAKSVYNRKNLNDTDLINSLIVMADKTKQKEKFRQRERKRELN